MRTIIVVLVAMGVTNTAALSQCSKYPDIPKLLAKIGDCYKDGKPPVNLVGYNKEVTLNYISKDILPGNVSCVKGSQQPGKGLVDFFLSDGSQAHVTYKQQVDGNKIVEFDSSNIQYDIFPIRNEFCYSYYRCIVSEGVEGTGEPMLALYVKCGYQNNPWAKKEIDTFLRCAEKLNVHNIVQITPCYCESDEDSSYSSS
ncbi:uncharacterized protein LOC128992623 isoform X1 [Macrosteles quadrilineatus]|uniref:uncharacterized protein LOC128992623 isoform X1 n=1 Tax=Macrosteles quadrilineatus TaxID=74068 RepID=UPI0023E0F853|nr:uncharacterized protein LOC128992623 isoform X1 [Macrosteles quadrilineatus]